MSRTDKDRPYWVKVRDEGVETHYHHATRYGRRSAYKRVPVLDENGDQIIEKKPIMMTAKQVIETVPRLKRVQYTAGGTYWDTRTQSFRYSEYTLTSAKIANPIYSEAERLVALGMPDALVQTEVREVPKFEEVFVGYNDGCDYDPDGVGRAVYWSTTSGKELPHWKYSGYHCRCSWCRPGDEPRQRTRKRVFLTQMRKAANSGEEHWEDDFNELDLSQPDMYHRGWC